MFYRICYLKLLEYLEVNEIYGLHALTNHFDICSFLHIVTWEVHGQAQYVFNDNWKETFLKELDNQSLCKLFDNNWAVKSPLYFKLLPIDDIRLVSAKQWMIKFKFLNEFRNKQLEK